jgi:hypothetical protein
MTPVFGSRGKCSPSSPFYRRTRSFNHHHRSHKGDDARLPARRSARGAARRSSGAPRNSEVASTRRFTHASSSDDAWEIDARADCGPASKSAVLADVRSAVDDARQIRVPVFERTFKLWATPHFPDRQWRALRVHASRLRLESLASEVGQKTKHFRVTFARYSLRGRIG